MSRELLEVEKLDAKINFCHEQAKIQIGKLNPAGAERWLAKARSYSKKMARESNPQLI